MCKRFVHIGGILCLPRKDKKGEASPTMAVLAARKGGNVLYLHIICPTPNDVLHVVVLQKHACQGTVCSLMKQRVQLAMHTHSWPIAYAKSVRCTMVSLIEINYYYLLLPLPITYYYVHSCLVSHLSPAPPGLMCILISEPSLT
jgi:hypothetical protein